MSTGAYFNVPAVTVVLVCTALLLAGTQLSARLNNVLVIANVAAITSLELRG
jgi:hypothetical protein